MQVSLGSLQALAESALAGAEGARITPGLAALQARLADPPAAPDEDYAALLEGAHRAPLIVSKGCPAVLH